MRTTDRGFTDEDGPPLGSEHPDLTGPDPARLFGWLFDQHSLVLHRYLARRVGQAAAEDLLSETFLIALNRRHSYDPARAAVRSWLFGIATNLVRQHVREEVRTLEITARAAGADVTFDAGHESLVAARVDAQAETRRLAAVLAELSSGDRDVLLLVSWAGLDTKEVAEALDIPVGTVHSRLHRVRKRLRVDASTSSTKEGGHA
ncbi:RNA polymerase sigma-70 factor (ECF subfamily) [Kibdelosporangium banguiense]|uniref:RNA polymerase sigma-70 factor (ECF subfamily) n=1 Tax=Kibdelosporangium banguiense TaxID=1365924 RepID=A0ABS4T7G0_9PSEU|nr:RNA polymerase sigma factor [Kibdelosporangium banguiense]MBP2320367.1 RNA polymerase sigma-70 factor (ECF subfamily) [Kibdelosporangium banguiense]